jgi:hypothetical protein
VPRGRNYACALTLTCAPRCTAAIVAGSCWRLGPRRGSCTRAWCGSSKERCGCNVLGGAVGSGAPRPSASGRCCGPQWRWSATWYPVASNVPLPLKWRGFEEPASHIEGTIQPGTTSPRYIQAQYSDVQRPIEISITTPATRGIGTGKAFAVAFPYVQTGVAHLRGVGRRHQMQDDSSILSIPAWAAAFHPVAGVPGLPPIGPPHFLICFPSLRRPPQP